MRLFYIDIFDRIRSLNYLDFLMFHYKTNEGN